MADTSTPRSLGGVQVSPAFVLIVAITLSSFSLLLKRPSTASAFVFVVAGWILSLVLHEFAHAYVAWRGGDHSVAAKGYLSLDPRRYVDPFTSLVLPMFLVLAGGIGLPGGAVWINRSALRSPMTATAVALAGPTANLVGAAVCFVPITLGFVSPTSHLAAASALAFLGFLQVTALILNLLPMPGLDGFGALEPHLAPATLSALTPLRRYGMLGLFLALWFIDPIRTRFWNAVMWGVDSFGVDRILVWNGFDLFQFWR